MGHPIRRIFAADVDNDGHIEILVSTDGKDLAALSFYQGEISSGRCFQEKWRYRFDNRLLFLCVTDLDNDGKIEIIAGSEDKHIYIFDAHGKTIWQHNHKFRIFSLYPYDIDNDGVPELLVASEHERVRAMRIRLRKGLEGKIRKYYRQLNEPEPATLSGLTTNERDMLQDIIREDLKEEHDTLKRAQDLINEGEYVHALASLLKLQQNKVDRLGRKETNSDIFTGCC